MGLLKEFREFAVKGNVIDLAVGVIIGAAFGKIVNSLVEDVIMPPIGVLLGRVNFVDLFIILPGQDEKIAAAKAAKLDLHTLADVKKGAIATFNYGQFINNVVQFLVIAFAVFLMVRAINQLKKVVEPPPPAGEPDTKECPYCLSTIPIKARKCSHCTADLPAEA